MNSLNTPPPKSETPRTLDDLIYGYQFTIFPYICISSILFGGLIGLSVMCRHYIPKWWIFALIIQSLVLSVYWFCKYTQKKWINSITEEEIAILQSTADSKNEQLTYYTKNAREVLKVYKKMEVNTEKELLRASNSASAEQLLRPTTAYTETPKEEMLRASKGRQ